jgi:hypothetical protein
MRKVAHWNFSAWHVSFEEFSVNNVPHTLPNASKNFCDLTHRFHRCGPILYQKKEEKVRKQ